MTQIKAVCLSPAFLKGEIKQRDKDRRRAYKTSKPYRNQYGKPAERIPWEQRACLGMDTALFFMEGSTRSECRDACARCPVQAQCLERALANESEMCYSFGYVGGMDAKHRQKIVGARNQAIEDAKIAEAVRMVREDHTTIMDASRTTGVAWSTIKSRLIRSA